MTHNLSEYNKSLKSIEQVISRSRRGSMGPNQVTELLKIRLPIIQAPMAGGATTPELIAAVSNSGGLGSLGAGYMPADVIRKSIKQIRQLTDKPFAVNLFVPEKHHATNEQIEQAKKIIQAAAPELKWKWHLVKPPYAPSFEEQMNVILEEEVPIFSFTFGIPDENSLAQLKKLNIKLIGTATTLQEAKLLEERGIDIIIAQGSEAGGHRGTFLGRAEDALIGTSALIHLLVDQIKIPIIAAGGIMDARGIVSSLIQGSAGVQMGTAFLTCTESGIHPSYKEKLLQMTYDNTTLTRVFSGKLARGITNKFITRMESQEKYILDYPIQNALTNPMRKEAAKQNTTDFMSMWAGQAAYLCKDISTMQLMQELERGIEVLLKMSVNK